MHGNVYMCWQAPSLMELYQIRPLDLKIISGTHAHRRSYYKLCVCVCVCDCVCLWVCVSVIVCVCVCMSVSVCVWMCDWVSVCVFVWERESVWLCVCVSVIVCECVCMSVSVCEYVIEWVSVCVCVCKSECVSVCVTMGDARLRKYMEQLIRRLLFGWRLFAWLATRRLGNRAHALWIIADVINVRDISWLQINVREDVLNAALRERTQLEWSRSRGSDKTWKSEMLMTTELVINWSPGDLVQSLRVLRKLERLSDGDATSDHGSKSYIFVGAPLWFRGTYKRDQRLIYS